MNMETEDVAKAVDTIYKNLIDKFNPSARQLINAGKAYLKALHGAAAASKIYLDTLSRVAKLAQQGPWGGTADIGVSLQQMVDVYKEIQNQQLNMLKAFYVDLLVPVETNLEKDLKVVQAEQKKFTQQHKQFADNYAKAANQAKKSNKSKTGKNQRNSVILDKEIKQLQALDEEKTKLDGFCEQSLKNAILQERRRYGFVLERQCSLAKHWTSYHLKGHALLDKYWDVWQETAKSRDAVPDCVDMLVGTHTRLNDNIYALPGTLNLSDDADRLSFWSQLRKTRSLDTSCVGDDLDEEDDQLGLHEAVNSSLAHHHSSHAHIQPDRIMNRAKSEYNLTTAASSPSCAPSEMGISSLSRPKSIALPSRGSVRALYAYLSSGENQLSFLEGDLITLLGEKSKGWQYGENSRTGKRGWFPVAYTEFEDTDGDSGLGLRSNVGSLSVAQLASAEDHTSSAANTTNSQATILAQPSTLPRIQEHPGSAKTRPVSFLMDPIVIRPTAPLNKLRKSRSAFADRLVIAPTSTKTTQNSTPSSPFTPLSAGLNSPSDTPSRPSIAPPPPPPRLPVPTTDSSSTVVSQTGPASMLSIQGGVANTSLSLRSSNDSGFSNDGGNAAPPQPEADYSDEDAPRSGTRSLRADLLLAPSDGNTEKAVRGWLLYQSALELQADVEQHEQPLQSQNSPTSTTMTLGRITRRSTKANASNVALDHIATLTRPRPPTERQRVRGRSEYRSSWACCEAKSDEKKTTSRLFAKKNSSANSVAKSRPVFPKFKTAWRSKSKDSGLDALTSSNIHDSLWEHESLVPLYVGWRPKLPLPDPPRPSILEPAKRRLPPTPRSTSNQDTDYSTETESVTSSALLPMLPSLPPTLPFLTPVLTRKANDYGNETIQRSKEHNVDYQQRTKLKLASLHSHTVVRRSLCHKVDRNTPILKTEEAGKGHETQHLPHTLPRSKSSSAIVHRSDCNSSPPSPLIRKHSKNSNESACMSSASALTTHHVSFSLDHETISEPGYALQINVMDNKIMLISSTPNESAILSQKDDRSLTSTHADGLSPSKHAESEEAGNEDIGNSGETTPVESISTSDEEGLLAYGKRLQERLYSALSGSALDQRSETTGNMCGPWYDLWGVDVSVSSNRQG